jgi:hypothetical protein
MNWQSSPAALGPITNISTADVHGLTVDYFEHIAINQPLPDSLLTANPHFLTPRDLKFDSSSFAELDPPFVSLSHVPCFEMRSCNVTLTNVLTNTSLTVFEVATFSEDVFCISSSLVTIAPGDHWTTKLYVCPRRPGSHSALVRFHTNRGIIPYSISWTADRNGEDLRLRNVVHFSFASPGRPFSLPLPWLPDYTNFTVHFDSSVFDQNRFQASGRGVEFLPSNLKAGVYRTFIHVLAVHCVRSIPVWIVTSSLTLKPAESVFHLFAALHGEASVPIELIEMGESPHTIISATLSASAPANLHWEPIWNPTPSNNVIRIGKLSLVGAKPGHFTTSITVRHQAGKSENVQTIEVTVRCFVADEGSFAPIGGDLMTVEYAPKMRHEIRFINSHSSTVAILDVATDSRHCRFSRFRPFVVPAGEESRAILVKCRWSLGREIKDRVTVSTNVSAMSLLVGGSVRAAPSESPDLAVGRGFGNAISRSNEL